MACSDCKERPSGIEARLRRTALDPEVRADHYDALRAELQSRMGLRYQIKQAVLDAYENLKLSMYHW
jgi:hypothetical protein